MKRKDTHIVGGSCSHVLFRGTWLNHAQIPTLTSVEEQVLNLLKKNKVMCKKMHSLGFCWLPTSSGFTYNDGCGICSCLIGNPEKRNITYWLESEGAKLDLWPENPINQVFETPNPGAALTSEVNYLSAGSHRGRREAKQRKHIPTIETCSGNFRECHRPVGQYQHMLCDILTLIQQQHLFNHVEDLRVAYEDVTKPRRTDHAWQIAKYTVVKLKQATIPSIPTPLALPLQAARVIPLTLAAWNVRFLLDHHRSNRPERRTLLVARELARYKADIAALSETRLSEQGQLEEVGAGYTFFWSSQP
ncbi:unnamed protein product [Schistocephalus solidus]|uniref:Endo/exonuclease/phosphatase domain-containing protein n=1 Tax=Schistocephalus solidus TaxID=70667 RepID=A0A183SUL8_SCHSO|nr:unnamed protein product [Schistocephalus solidus]